MEEELWYGECIDFISRRYRFHHRRSIGPLNKIKVESLHRSAVVSFFFFFFFFFIRTRWLWWDFLFLFSCRLTFPQQHVFHELPYLHNRPGVRSRNGRNVFSYGSKTGSFIWQNAETNTAKNKNRNNINNKITFKCLFSFLFLPSRDMFTISFGVSFLSFFVWKMRRSREDEGKVLFFSVKGTESGILPFHKSIKYPKTFFFFLCFSCCGERCAFGSCRSIGAPENEI